MTLTSLTHRYTPVSGLPHGMVLLVPPFTGLSVLYTHKRLLPVIKLVVIYKLFGILNRGCQSQNVPNAWYTS